MVQLIALRTDSKAQTIDDISTIMFYVDDETIDDEKNIFEITSLLDK